MRKDIKVVHLFSQRFEKSWEKGCDYKIVLTISLNSCKQLVDSSELKVKDGGLF